MCLAVPARITRTDGESALAELRGTRLRISTLLVPEVREGDWVLIHAGFAITRLSDEDAREQWSVITAAESRAAADAAAAGAGAGERSISRMKTE